MATMIFVLVWLVAVGLAKADSSDYDEDMFGLLGRATTLYFHERTLTKTRAPKPQLVCRNTMPADGCALRRVAFAECHRKPEAYWMAWECIGHGADRSLVSAGLELHRLSIDCGTDEPESCSLTYTLRYDNKTAQHIELEKLRGACAEMHPRHETVWSILTVLFAYSVSSVFAFMLAYVQLNRVAVKRGYIQVLQPDQLWWVSWLGAVPVVEKKEDVESARSD